MTIELEHIVSNTPRGDNPLADRFNHLPKKKKGAFPRVAYVLQGGGALGSYQCGVVKGLLEAGYEPDWVAATSIGAIQAAIIVGNPPEKRVEKLAQFWHMVAPPTLFDLTNQSDEQLNEFNFRGASSALLFGQPHFFYPRWCMGQMPSSGSVDQLSFYDTSPLRETLLELVDFDLLNSAPIRLSLGAVQIRTGHLIYFNNINYKITPEHIMASGALPPGFPAIEIDGDHYWDGGVHSNSPLEVILEADPPDDTLCFLIDCFGGATFLPSTMNEVDERVKDIRNSTHAQRTILNYLQRQKMRQAMKELRNVLSAKQLKEHQKLIDIGDPHHCTLVHIIYSARIAKQASKDYNFDSSLMERRIEIGYQNVQDMLKEKSKWGYVPEDNQSRLYEPPTNSVSSLLFRKKRGTD